MPTRRPPTSSSAWAWIEQIRAKVVGIECTDRPGSEGDIGLVLLGDTDAEGRTVRVGYRAGESVFLVRGMKRRTDMNDIPLGCVIPDTMQTNLLGRRAIVNADEVRRLSGTPLETEVEIVSVYAIKTLMGNAFGTTVLRDDGGMWDEVFLSHLTLLMPAETAP